MRDRTDPRLDWLAGTRGDEAEINAEVIDLARSKASFRFMGTLDSTPAHRSALPVTMNRDSVTDRHGSVR